MAITCIKNWFLLLVTLIKDAFGGEAVPAVSRGSMKNHLAQLDGLRGIAILIVILGHLLVYDYGFGNYKLSPLPPMGVDLFFVLSGFLITGILLRVKGQKGYFKNFYARRALRVWPLYYLLLAFLFLIAAPHFHALSFDRGGPRWIIYSLYLQNICYKQFYLMGPATLTVTWSLAVEEQFYLVWPLLVYLLSPKKLAVILTGIILTAPVARIIVTNFGIDPYFNPLCRLDAMAMGSLLGMWIHFRKPGPSQMRLAAVQILAFVLTGEIVLFSLHLIPIGSKSLISLGFVAIVLLALSTPAFSRGLSVKPLVLTGGYSYCMYLTHVGVALMIHSRMPGSSIFQDLVRSICIVGSTYVVASLSWRFVEEPILRLKRHFPSEPSIDSVPEPSGFPVAGGSLELS
jgi:peptidoglycan/LPS O-acetylase OafA/YrhL